ncbi:MAG: LCP family protein [Patescibacteria group bacterium]
MEKVSSRRKKTKHEPLTAKVERVGVKRKIERKSVRFSRFKRRALKHLWLVRVGLLVGVFLLVFVVITLVGAAIKRTEVGSYVSLVTNFIFTPSDKVNALQGRTNVLVLGKGGKGHEAPDLTDTIIFASIRHSDPSLTLISLSRDIWVPELRAKLNSTYYWGEQKQEGGGLILAKSTVEKIVGTPVHYGFIIDFSGFTEIIDVMGGIDVEVGRAFTDELYPVAGREEDECDGDTEYKCRYVTVGFEKGVQVMDGETALKFVRSRNAEGEEGTDMARAKRQQKVLVATREKAVSLRILLNPKKILSILSILGDSIETDIDPSAAAILTRRVFSAKENIYSEVLSEDLLENPPKSFRYDNLYVFIPKDETWGDVQEWVECVLENGGCD